jgi:hypothetical protein
MENYIENKNSVRTEELAEIGGKLERIKITSEGGLVNS